MRIRGPAVAALLVSVAACAGAREVRHAQGSSLPTWAAEACQRPSPAGAIDVAYLHDETIVEPLESGGVRVTTRDVVRALASTGLEQLGSVGLQYNKDDEVVAVSAWSLGPDGTVRTPTGKADETYDIPFSSSDVLIEDVRLRSVTLPGVQVGSCVARERVVVVALDHGATSFTFGSADEPLAFARFELRLPGSMRFETVKLRGEAIAEERTDSGMVLTAKDLVPLPRMELRPPANELLPMAWARWWNADGTRGFADWDALGRWYWKLVEPARTDRGESAEIGARLRPSSPEGVLDAVSRAFAFAARDVRYVAIEIGIGGFKPDTPAQVCRNRHGDCKAKSFLLSSLVQGCGLTAYPVLVRTKDLGPVVAEVPTPAQFNHVISAVVLGDDVPDVPWPTRVVPGLGRLLFLDATARSASPWSLREDDQGTRGLVVHPAGATLVDLPWQPPSAGSALRQLEARLDENGLLADARLVETWSGSQAADVRGFYADLDDADRRQAQQADVNRRYPGATLSEHSIAGLENVEVPVVETTLFEGGRVGKRVLGLIVVEPAKSERSVLPLLPPPPRALSVWLGLPRTDIVELSLAVPAGWVPETLPAPTEVASTHFTLSSRWSFDGSHLSRRRVVRVLSPEVAPADYVALRDAVTKAVKEDSRGVVLVEAPKSADTQAQAAEAQVPPTP